MKNILIKCCLIFLSMIAIFLAALCLYLNLDMVGIVAFFFFPIIIAMSVPFFASFVVLISRLNTADKDSVKTAVFTTILFSIGALLWPMHREKSGDNFFFAHWIVNSVFLGKLLFYSSISLIWLSIYLNFLYGTIKDAVNVSSRIKQKRFIILFSLFLIIVVVINVAIGLKNNSVVVNENSAFTKLLYGDLGINRHTLFYLKSCLKNDKSNQPFFKTDGLSTSFLARGCMAKHLEAKRLKGELKTEKDFLLYCDGLPKKYILVYPDQYNSNSKKLNVSYKELCIKEYFWTILERDGTTEDAMAYTWGHWDKNKYKKYSQDFLNKIVHICRTYENLSLEGGYNKCISIFVKAGFVKYES